MTALALDVRELSFEELDGVSGGDIPIPIPIPIPNPVPAPIGSPEWIELVICGGPNGPL